MTTSYRVNDIYASIQGEGAQTGTPMVLVRLQGCGVGCPWCDTKETWHVDRANKVSFPEMLGTSEAWAEATGQEIAAYCRKHYPALRWVLLTGGEPAEQDLSDLVSALHDAGLKVALETSGTALGHVGAGIDWVTVSPKIGMPGGKSILVDAVTAANEIKFVIGRKSDLDKLDRFLAEFFFVKDRAQVFLQPLSTSEKATELCMAACLEKGYNLSIQVHKYVGVR